MGINIKYFMVTIISIFLALGIGIFIGFMFDAQEILTTERDDLIEALNGKFQLLEIENKKHKDQINVLINQNESYKDFNEYIFPHLIKNRLTGITVGLIQLNNDHDYSNIIDSIIMAGGEVISINSLANMNSDFVFNNNIDEEVIDTADVLVEFDYFLLAGGHTQITSTNLDLLENLLSEDLATRKSEIIAIEKMAVDLPYVDWFKDYNITTINNVDSIYGKISLIFTLDKSTNGSETISIINRLMNSTINNYPNEE